MYEERRSKFSNLKNRAKFALGKSDNFETLDYKKKKFGGIDNRGKVKRGEIGRTKFNVEDDEFNNSRGRGLKSNYSGRKTGEVNGNDFKKERVYGSNGDRKFGATERRGSRDSEKKSWESHSKNRMFNKRESRDGRKNAENGENRMFIKRDSRENGENRMFIKRDSRENGESRMFNRRDSRENGENRMFIKRDSRENGENRMFNRRDSREESVVRRNNSENGETRSGFLRKNRDEKSENNKQLQSPAEDHEFGRKKFYNKKNSAAADDSMTSFERPRRKRRLIRIGYKNDTANKRFDDSLPTIDNTKKQKEDSDTEENAENPEMSQNAQFRAIQPTPSIISFVNENLLGRRREIEFRKAGYNIELPSPLDDTPFSTSSDRERIEESVFRNKLAFFAAAKVSSSFPDPDLPEIAFAGRSNVGKSSLLNSLTRQWGVVRTSDKPGLTQTINFFNLGSKLCLVDLPGYGFAYAKDEVKESWEELVKEYVSTREGLKRVCLLIDTKWGMKARDHELIGLMERSKTKYQIVLTKTDLAFPADVARRAMQIEDSLKTNKSAVQPLMMVSSKTGAGIRSLRTVLSNISRFARL